MTCNALCYDILVGLGTNIVATLIALFVALVIRDSVYYSRRYGGWRVNVTYGDREVIRGGRDLSWAEAKEISQSVARESVLLKGIVSPFARLHVDLITEGRDTGLLREQTEPSKLLGITVGQRRIYTIDLRDGENDNLLTLEPLTRRVLHLADDRPQVAPSPPPASTAPPMLLNFAHPLTAEQVAALEGLLGQGVGETRQEPAQTAIDPERPLREQAAAIIDGFGLSPEAWQTRPILINPPGYAPAAVAVLAEIHGRRGNFPAVVRLRPIAQTTPTRYEVAEIVNLNDVRDAAREKRRA